MFVTILIIAATLALMVFATTTRRFYNPHDVLHGAVEVTTVQSVTLNRGYQRINAQGDDDITDTFQAKTNLQVNGQIVIQDPIQADALIDAAEGTLVWKGVPQTGGTVKTITVTGVSFFSANETDAHNAVDGITLGWNAFSPTGVDPVTMAVAP